MRFCTIWHAPLSLIVPDSLVLLVIMAALLVPHTTLSSHQCKVICIVCCVQWVIALESAGVAAVQYFQQQFAHSPTCEGGQSESEVEWLVRVTTQVCLWVTENWLSDPWNRICLAGLLPTRHGMTANLYSGSLTWRD